MLIYNKESLSKKTRSSNLMKRKQYKKNVSWKHSEIAALHSDIQELRMAITSGEIKGSDGAARLASLEKELRSHIETSDRMNKTADKRGLTLAGADRVMRELTNIFKDDPQFAEPIENAMMAVWAKIYSEMN